MTLSRIGRLTRDRVRGAGGLAAALVLLVVFGMGCSATPDHDHTSGHDHVSDHGTALESTPERPPPVRLLAGAEPEGVLIYESWVTDGELRTSEPEAVPADLVTVPWRRDEPLTFEVESGKPPVYADVLVYDRLPADRVPNTEPESIQCLPREAASPCRVDERPDDSLIRMTVLGSVPSEIVILNIGWARPETDRDQDPNLPLQVSASWAFAVEASR